MADRLRQGARQRLAAVLWRSALVVALVYGPASPAGQARPVADDPVLEARMLALTEELRCLVCQNQTLADSHAELANDLKNEVRAQLRAGRSDAQILEFMVSRYGQFVLYRPPLTGATLLLWVGPGLLLVGGLMALARRLRRGADEPQEPMDARQRDRAALLLGADKEP